MWGQQNEKRKRWWDEGEDEKKKGLGEPGGGGGSIAPADHCPVPRSTTQRTFLLLVRFFVLTKRREACKTYPKGEGTSKTHARIM